MGSDVIFYFIWTVQTMRKMEMVGNNINESSYPSSLDAILIEAHKSRSIYLMRLCSTLLTAIKFPPLPKMNVSINTDYKCNTHNIAAMLR